MKCACESQRGPGTAAISIDPSRLLRERRLADQPQARRRMIQRLARLGISPSVLVAMSQIPRHAFVPPALVNRAYSEDCRPVAGDPRVITSPSGVAWMTHHLALDRSKKVLEIGTGTGYQTAILALLSGHVYTVEIVPELVRQSARAFAALGLKNISQRQGDGFQGWPEAAPFDAILVTAAPVRIPPALLRQLSPRGGRLVIPVGLPGSQRLLLVQRHGTRFLTRDLGPACFVPLVSTTPTRSAGRALQPNPIRRLQPCYPC